MPDAPFVQGPLAIAARAGPLGAKWRAGCGTNGAPDARLWAHPGGRGGPVFGASFGARLRTKKWSPFRTKSCRPGGVKMRSCVELHTKRTLSRAPQDSGRGAKIWSVFRPPKLDRFSDPLFRFCGHPWPKGRWRRAAAAVPLGGAHSRLVDRIFWLACLDGELQTARALLAAR